MATAALDVRGGLIRPGDAGYEEARRVHNGMIDRRPALIARCGDAADVIAAVNYAREDGMLLAVRGGGHNGPGFGTCDGGLVIDLSPMQGVRVDPHAATVRVGGGCTWGDVDHATHAFGMATPGGIISTTGVGGLTLGGGVGHLTRRCGLSIDSLLEVDVVLADGSFVTASDGAHPDLFWAVRGGGGNFGVVTSFVFRLHPVGTVFAGPTLWDLDRAEDVMRFYRDLIAGADDDLNGFFAFLRVPPGPPFPEHLHLRPMCGVVWCYTGALDRAEEVFRPILAYGPPTLALVGPMPHPALQSMFDGLYPAGLLQYWRADFVNELSDEAIALHVRHGSQVPNFQSTMHLYPVDGAAGRVGKNDTAFSYRDARWASVFYGVDSDPASMDGDVAWVKDYWEALHPFSAGGAYVNMIMDEGQERVMASYRDNYPRLAGVKNRYDPRNVFRVNQNIRPTG
jgi:FAD/FMN-containing dehydrogenase